MSEPSTPRPWWEGDYVWRPSGKEAAEEQPAAAVPEPLLVQCWRCGQAVEDSRAKCPHCLAALDPARPSRRETRERRPKPAQSSGGVLPMVWFYIGILIVSLVQALLYFSKARDGDVPQGFQDQVTIVVEVIDSILVLIALFVIPRPPRFPEPLEGQRALGWLLALPVLAGLLGLNLAYHHVLRHYLGVREVDPFGGLTVLVLLTVCVQPAVIEELFFRYLALGTLRRFMGTHGAVLVSSVMFGLAHLGAPLSIPILIVVGMGLGYMRVMSRSLVVPIVMHFLHNLIVVLMVSKA